VIAASAAGELRELAQFLGAPVVTTMMGRGAFPEDQPLSGFHEVECQSRDRQLNRGLLPAEYRLSDDRQQLRHAVGFLNEVESPLAYDRPL
jgi:glyoxylate carboligase